MIHTRKTMLTLAVLGGLLVALAAPNVNACTWCIEKEADFTNLELSMGQQQLVTYTVTLTQNGSCDSEFPSSASIYDTNLPINPGYERMCGDLPAAYLDWFICEPTVGDAPKTFTKVYTKNVGPYYECGDYTVVNTACLPDWVSECGSSSWTISIHVPCGGCTLTQGYWKTHSKYGPAPYDDGWALKGEDSMFFLSGQSWYEILWTAPKKGNAYYILAHQFIAATLNILNEASSTPEVDAALSWATNFFNTYGPEPAPVEALRRNALKRADLLDQYNNGYIGPGHCSE